MINEFQAALSAKYMASHAPDIKGALSSLLENPTELGGAKLTLKTAGSTKVLSLHLQAYLATSGRLAR